MIVLTTLLGSVIAKAEERARAIVCLSNLRGIDRAVRMHCLDGDGSFPPFVYWFRVLPPDDKMMVAMSSEDHTVTLVGASPEPEVFLCPSDYDPKKVWCMDEDGKEQDIAISYGYNMALYMSGLRLEEVQRPSGTALLFDGDPKGVEGQWKDDKDWHKDTIEKRHHGRLNVLFVDGHVELLEKTSEEMFHP